MPASHRCVANVVRVVTRCDRSARTRRLAVRLWRQRVLASWEPSTSYVATTSSSLVVARCSAALRTTSCTASRCGVTCCRIVTAGVTLTIPACCNAGRGNDTCRVQARRGVTIHVEEVYEVVPRVRQRRTCSDLVVVQAVRRVHIVFRPLWPLRRMYLKPSIEAYSARWTCPRTRSLATRWT